MPESGFSVSGLIFDVVARRSYPGIIRVEGGRIASVEDSVHVEDQVILPGLVDAHIHVESSMLAPSEFARLACVHGTVAVVSDPHEIANVLGMEGIRFMMRSGARVPLRFYFGAPSCVPATPFESSGAEIGVRELDELLGSDHIHYLSEMMNWPGVIHDDPQVMAKLEVARKHGKPVDGHAPGLKGQDAGRYAQAGITTDHECFTLDEALDKIGYGMSILIREGSAARNFDALISLLKTHPERVMFCSDDKHPDDLMEGHINLLAARAIRMGYDPFDVLRACSLNPRNHYHLDNGLLQPGDPADILIADSITDLNVRKLYINGVFVAENGKCLFPAVHEETPNHFVAGRISPEQLAVRAGSDRIRVIRAFDGQLVTEGFLSAASITDGMVVPDTGRDILKLVVLNRYRQAPPAIAFISGFGLRRGAIGSTIAHDSHNIIAVGTNDKDIAGVINLLVDHKGGIAFRDGGRSSILPLPVAGIMSDLEGTTVAALYKTLDKEAKNMGSGLKAPFMTLSFMALLVIPDLKLSDKGLFDGKQFIFTDLFAS
ncbi:MAG: adenine deaminase [Bacteroidales bacterium]|nr:adenine deaminase [Bacteroidales bacterium]